MDASATVNPTPQPAAFAPLRACVDFLKPLEKVCQKASALGMLFFLIMVLITALDVGLPLLVVIAPPFGQQDGAQTVWVLPMGDGEGPERAYGSGGGESGL